MPRCGLRQGFLRTLACAGALSLTVLWAPTFAVAGPTRAGVAWARLDARCEIAAGARRPYEWPLRPFDRQHPVRGFFGDPRTLAFRTPLSATRPGEPGAFSFHNGVDIVGRPGQAVYPVASGLVDRAGPDELILDAGPGLVFQYWHLDELVRTGQRVVAYRTVLGTIRAVWGHVHLSEIRNDCAVNPLAPGQLEPFLDPVEPHVLSIEALSPSGVPLPTDGLRGAFELVADAAQQPPLPVPKPWSNLPVTPALVTWRLSTAGGRIIVPTTIAADFRYTIPPKSDFWKVYAARTHQNVVVGSGARAPSIPGVYVFRLEAAPARLRPGRYTVTVTVTNTCGARTVRRQGLTVPAPAPPLPLASSPAARPSV